jgi:hypothetical protein
LKRKFQWKSRKRRSRRAEKKRSRKAEESHAPPPKESEQDSPAGFPLLLSPEMPLLSPVPPLSSGCLFFPPRCLPFLPDAPHFLRLTASAAGVFTDAKAENLSFADRKIIFLQNES